jgi:DNA-directed RNA polymerase alpha subunit
MLDPTPKLPDDTPIIDINLPTQIRNALAAAGLKTVGEAREASDAALLSFPDFGKASVAHLRESLDLPSCDRVTPLGKRPACKTAKPSPAALKPHRVIKLKHSLTGMP